MHNNLLNKILNAIFKKIVLQKTSIDRIGLFDGKMGIAIFLYKYAKFNQSPLAKELADCFIDDVFNNINSKLTIGFNDGLCGIGWGIEYLVQNNLVVGDTNEILSDFDSLIFQTKIINNSYSNSCIHFDVGLYYLARIMNQNNTNSFDSNNIYLNRIFELLYQLLLYNRIDNYWAKMLNITLLISVNFYLIKLDSHKKDNSRLLKLIEYLPSYNEVAIVNNSSLFNQLQFYIMLHNHLKHDFMSSFESNLKSLEAIITAFSMKKCVLNEQNKLDILKYAFIYDINLNKPIDNRYLFGLNQPSAYKNIHIENLRMEDGLAVLGISLFNLMENTQNN